MEKRKSGKSMKGGTLEDKMDSQEIDEDRQNGRYLQPGPNTEYAELCHELPQTPCVTRQTRSK
jgi:hypothetical protein